MDKQLQNNLSNILELEIPDEMIQHILSLRNPNEVDEYFSTLLDYSNDEHLTFVNDFKEERFKQKFKSGKKKGAISRPSAAREIIPKQDEIKPEVQKSKKKNKFTNLYNTKGSINEILLQGRHQCSCQASKHKLINNCLSCGRIVCEQEGPGPCLFCGSVVRGIDETDRDPVVISKKNGTKPKQSKDREDAIAQRNRLLEYDRQSEKRTTVIDDESDYFKSNSVWLSNEERVKLQKMEEELRDRKHANRLRHTYKFDFSGRQILDDEDTLDYDAYANVASMEKTGSNSYASVARDLDLNFLKIDEAYPELNANNEVIHTKSHSNKVQDKTLLEISDQGHCLSMHQPWASLLVAGVKKDEGRNWYTSHRGRLWIASTAKPANPEEIKEIENFYKRFYNDENIKFPTQYPSGSLLGHVTVDNCLSQEDYQLEHPHGESESPFVFICINPTELPIYFPISGKHKIYKLDGNIHVAAMRSLHKCGKL
ncbi:activating signal cointegrator 1 [Sergentomyia squamirostris]